MLKFFRQKSKFSHTSGTKRTRQKTQKTLAAFAILLLISAVIINVISPPKAKAAIALDANLGATFETAGSTTHTHNTTAPAVARSTIIAVFRGYTSATTLTVSGGGLSWTVDKTIQASGPNAGDNYYIASAYASSGLASGTTLTFTTAASVFDAVMLTQSFTGITPSSPVDQSNGAWANTSSTGWNSGNITTTNANDLLFGAGFFDNVFATFTPGGSFNEIHDYQVNQGTGMAFETIYQIVSSTNTYAASGTSTTASDSRGQMIVAYRAGVFPQNPNVIDNFTGTNGSAISGRTASSGATWGDLYFSQSGAQINGDQFASNGALYGSHYINSTTYGPNTEVYTTIANNGGVTSGNEIIIIMARLTGPPNTSSVSGYGIQLDGGTSNNMNFWKVDNNSQAFIGGCSAISQAVTNGDKIGLTVTGTTNPVLEAWYNTGGGWVSKGTCTDTGAAAKYQGSGNIGLESGNNASVRFDDFSGGTMNSIPSAPTLSAPSNAATGVSVTPQFQLRTTDADYDYLKYKIEVCSTSNCSSVVRTIDQTSSQTGWSGQDQQSSAAYTGNPTIGSSTMAVHSYQPSALSAGTQYWWRAYAIDPGGNNGFSSVSSIWSFTTGSSNAAPAIPTLVSPSSSETGVTNLPIFQLRTTDADADYLKYFIQLYDAASCGGSQVGSDIDQTSSQTGWQGQDATSGTAYIGASTISGSTIARYQHSGTALLPNRTYSWRAKAKDTGGSSTFSSLTSCQSFTTGSSEVQIRGGVEINGGTTIQ